MFSLSKTFDRRTPSSFLKIPVLLFCLSLTACGASLHYYSQALQGHFAILGAYQPIEEVLADESVSDEVKKKLRIVKIAKEYAETELGLPSTNLYDAFVEIDRDYVLWNVFAAPEFEVDPKIWCHPFFGCLAYQGYFKEADAHTFAEKLSKQGMEVYVGNVAAYSTLGLFNDPVLSTFLEQPDAVLMGVIFHEVTHKLMYFKNDTTFNESFANAVAQEGLKRYLIEKGELEIYDNYIQGQKEKNQFIDLNIRTREKLIELYASLDASDPNNHPVLRAQKQQLFEDLEAEYVVMSADWENPDRYIGWFDETLNNAKLNSLAAYHSLVPAFKKLLENNDYDLPAFYRACRDLEPLTKEERHQYLMSLLEE